MLTNQQILEKAIAALSSEYFDVRCQTLEMFKKELNIINASEGKPASIKALVKIAYETFEQCNKNYHESLAGTMKDAEGNLIVTNTHYIIRPADKELFKALPQALNPVNADNISRIIAEAAATRSVETNVTLNKKPFLSMCRLHKKAELVKIKDRYFSIDYIKRFFKASNTLTFYLGKKQYYPTYVVAENFDAVLTECRHKGEDGALVLKWEHEEVK